LSSATFSTKGEDHVKRQEKAEGQDQPPQKKKTAPLEPAQKVTRSAFTGAFKGG
jgi:hypothetical protein